MYTVHKVLNASYATSNQHARHVTSQQYGALIGPQYVFPCVTIKRDAGDTLDHPLDTNSTSTIYPDTMNQNKYEIMNRLNSTFH